MENQNTNSFWFHLPAMHLYLLILFSSTVPISYGCNRLDRDALLSITLNFSLSPLTPLNWPLNIDCCLWEGITCNRQGHVTRLWLPSSSIKGSLSPSFLQLVHISHLNLSHNQLFGPLPHGFFSSLINLVTVDLSFNLFSESLPSFYPLPLSVQTVDLSSNYFSGEVQPSFLEFTSRLTYFNVSNNGVVGRIPLPMCNSSTLIKFLDFSSNLFNGQIPRGLGRCSKVEIFRAGFNSLSGLLPSDINNLMALTEFSLPWNFLSGPIGDNLGQLSNLTLLELYNNGFTGFLPSNIGELSNLETLLLYNNHLTGSLPSSLMNCTKLVQLNLRVNNLEGDLSLFNFSKLEQLRVLDLGNNNFSKNFPESIYSCKFLTALRLSSNPIGWRLSEGILALESLSYLGLSSTGLINVSSAFRILSSCKSLRFLVLSRNFYHETLPYDLGNIRFDGLHNLQIVGLGGCNLMGKIPSWLANLRSLKVLDLSLNQLTGIIPLWLSSMPNLFYIDLSYNLLSGEIPRELSSLASLSRYARIVDPSSYMELPLFVLVTNYVNRQYNRVTFLPPAIYLGSNRLSGFIPIEIGQMKSLYILDLSSNNFLGTNPNQISELTQLEDLNLSYNWLSGEIPTSLVGLRFLSSFSVANNNLHGLIPQGGQFDTFPASSFLGNPKLCGPLIYKSCENLCGNSVLNKCHGNGIDEEGTVEEREDELLWIYITTIIGFIIGFWMVCGTLIYNTAWRNAYFQFLDNMNDKIYVNVVVYMSRLWMLVNYLVKWS